MNTKFASICTTALMTTALWLNAADPEKPKPGSPEFERMKTLVGSWTGKCDMGQGLVDMTMQYRLLAGGSVLEERVLPARRTRWSRCTTTRTASWP